MKNKAWHIDKALYGARQSGKLWYETIMAEFKDFDFKSMLV